MIEEKLEKSDGTEQGHYAWKGFRKSVVVGFMTFMA
jgi:hypothetical protein